MIGYLGNPEIGVVVVTIAALIPAAVAGDSALCSGGTFVSAAVDEFGGAETDGDVIASGAGAEEFEDAEWLDAGGVATTITGVVTIARSTGAESGAVASNVCGDIKFAPYELIAFGAAVVIPAVPVVDCPDAGSTVNEND
jgi:hypothetical protein